LTVFSEGIASSAMEQAMIKHVVRCKAPADALRSREEMRISRLMWRFI